MDLLNDNISIADNQLLLNLGNQNKNNIRIEPNDLFSINKTELSSRRNLSINTFYPIKPYNLNNYNNNIRQINNNIDNYNRSSNSSQIKPLFQK